MEAEAEAEATVETKVVIVSKVAMTMRLVFRPINLRRDSSGRRRVPAGIRWIQPGILKSTFLSTNCLRC